jgi:hypothetical protein
MHSSFEKQINNTEKQINQLVIANEKNDSIIKNGISQLSLLKDSLEQMSIIKNSLEHQANNQQAYNNYASPILKTKDDQKVKIENNTEEQINQLLIADKKNDSIIEDHESQLPLLRNDQAFTIEDFLEYQDNNQRIYKEKLYESSILKTKDDQKVKMGNNTEEQINQLVIANEKNDKTIENHESQMPLLRDQMFTIKDSLEHHRKQRIYSEKLYDSSTLKTKDDRNVKMKNNTEKQMAMANEKNDKMIEDYKSKLSLSGELIMMDEAFSYDRSDRKEKRKNNTEKEIRQLVVRNERNDRIIKYYKFQLSLLKDSLEQMSIIKNSLEHQDNNQDVYNEMLYASLILMTKDDQKVKGENNTLTFLSPDRKQPLPSSTTIKWTPINSIGDIEIRYLDKDYNKRIDTSLSSSNYDLNSGYYSLMNLKSNTMYFFMIKTDTEDYVFPFITDK